MFLRVVRAPSGKRGVKHEYVRAVEAYRDHDGKTRHQTVINLGRKDLLAAHLDLDKLGRLLHGDKAAAVVVNSDTVGAIGAWDWGPMLVARHLWRELGVEMTLDKLSARERGDAVRLSDRALVLVTNRLTAPGSEHALARWLESEFVCDRIGRRFIPAWRDDDERKASGTPRVRVEMRQLKQWYRTLDQLFASKAEIEHGLFVQLRDLFSLQVDMVFYDLTSSYFEGHRPPQLGAHGHSRDDKPRNPQVLVGLVMVDGWPIAHHLFEGNRRDCKTVPDVLRDLEQRFGLKRVVFVGDRGMVTKQNLDGLAYERSWLHRRPQSPPQPGGVRLYPKRDRTLDRMPGWDHRAREVTTTADVGSGGGFQRAWRSGVRRSFRGASGVRAQPARQVKGPSAQTARGAAAAGRQRPAQGG